MNVTHYPGVGWKIQLAVAGVDEEVILCSVFRKQAIECDDLKILRQAVANDPIDKVSCRPDFAILAYPVITMGAKTHGGSKANLIGQQPDEKLVEFYSNEEQVTSRTPPTFLFHTVQDKAVPIENSRMFKAACEKAGVPVELVEYEEGQHGVGLGLNTNLPLAGWSVKLDEWLRKRGLLER